MARPSQGDKSKRFDPRFNPEFQPGYDPRTHRAAPTEVWREPVTRPSKGAVITRPTTRAADAAPGPSEQSGQSAATDTVRQGEAVPVAAREAAENAADGADESPEWWRRLNPFLVALGAAGVALIGLSVGWMMWVYEAASNPFTQQTDYLIMQFALYGAPVLLAAGVLTLVSILVVLAVRYRR
ncbi:MAG TPA: hypothetical protein PK781_06230 [Terrimesophilobacter sp.]|nr:hypothetical protein [Terrimesophilobacter sp.]HRQ00040.1 hypothetical protein [Terrimesophilobacter sp.]